MLSITLQSHGLVAFFGNIGKIVMGTISAEPVRLPALAISEHSSETNMLVA